MKEFDEAERDRTPNEDRKSRGIYDGTRDTLLMAGAQPLPDPMGEYGLFGRPARPVAARQFQSLLALFPHLAAAPTGSKRKPSWPAPALELRQLLRTEKLAKMQGGLEILRDTEDLTSDAMRGRTCPSARSFRPRPGLLVP